MASGFVQVTLVGHVGQPPEVKTLDSGTQVASFSVAYTDRSENTTWYRVSAFGKLAEIVGSYVTKGRQVLVVGELNPRTYKGRDGVEKTSMDIKASEVKMLGKREEGAESPVSKAAPSKTARARAAQVDLAEEIPF